VDVAGIVAELTGKAFIARMVEEWHPALEHLPVNRSPLSRDPLVTDLGRVFQGPGGRAVVEGVLDELFKDLRKGVLFEHTEAVMVLLFSLREVGGPLFSDVIEELTETRSAELGSLRRFAKKMTVEEEDT